MDSINGEGYSLKEVIEKNFNDLRLDMRMGFSEIKSDMKEVRDDIEAAQDIAERAEVKADDALKRLNKYDKHFFVIYSAITLAIITAVIKIL